MTADGGHEPTRLHAERLDAVVDVLLAAAPDSVADLGCGSGLLLSRLARTRRFRRLAGLDESPAALEAARDRLRVDGPASDGSGSDGSRPVLLLGSFLRAHPGLRGFAAASLVETIEHVDPERLSEVEHAVFAPSWTALVVVTTPNAECNDLLGVPPGRRRHPGHRFEWTRARFAAWAEGVARRHRYAVAFQGIGHGSAQRGAPTQMAVFARRGAAA